MSITESVCFGADARPGPLSAEHEHSLIERSAISTDVIAERGIRTIMRGRELPDGFSRRQRERAPGILFTVHRPNGETDYCFRPDAPDPKKPGCKYEARCKAYGAPGNVLDVHPSLHHLMDDTSVPVIFVEGIKKADAITSAARAAGVEVVVVAITGVWNWLSDGEPIPDIFDLPVEGRRVTICFDSDMLHNPQVQGATHRLSEHLTERGAEVWIAYLQDQADGSKTGADDFLAGGGTLAELRMLTRRYDPDDFVTVRLSRDERLRLALEDLERRFWNFQWKGMGGYSARDVALKLIEAAKRHGNAVDDGIRVTKAQGPLAIEAKVSTRTLWKALARLEESGFLYRDNEGRKTDKAGSFVLCADVSHKGAGGSTQGTTTSPQDLLHAGDLQLRSPRLRWSRPKFTPRQGVVRGTRRVRQGVKLERRDGIKRLGKIRGAILDVLDAGGGVATLQELAGALHKARPRDLVRCKTKRGGRNGPVIMLLEAGIVEWVCDVETRREVLRLTEGWLEALEAQRKLGREVDSNEFGKSSDTLDRERYKRKSLAFHNRQQVKADEDPSEEEMRKHRESYPERRREAIAAAIVRLFSERPEYRNRRPGQVTCALPNYLGPDFERGTKGLPKDAEVEAILDGVAA